MAVETGEIWSKELGDAAVFCMCWIRSRAGRTCVGGSGKLALRVSPEQLGLHAAHRVVVGDERREGDQDLEQPAHRDEPRAEPAAAFEGAHGRAFEPDQSALPFQHAEYRIVADS